MLVRFNVSCQMSPNCVKIVANCVELCSPGKSGWEGTSRCRPWSASAAGRRAALDEGVEGVALHEVAERVRLVLDLDRDGAGCRQLDVASSLERPDDAHVRQHQAAALEAL